jgi:hypothetical protein
MINWPLVSHASPKTGLALGACCLSGLFVGALSLDASHFPVVTYGVPPLAITNELSFVGPRTCHISLQKLEIKVKVILELLATSG